jgi:hypothetical protein
MHWWDGQRWTGDTRPPSGEGGPFYYQPRQPTLTSALQQPTYPRQSPQHYQQPDPGWQPYSQQQQSHRRKASHGLTFAGLAALAIIAGGGACALAAHRTASAAKPLTCEQQFTAWKTGLANAPGKQLKADLGNVSSAGHDEDIAALTSALQAAASDAVTLEQYPMPACADPRGYWVQILARIKASGDNAASNSGLNALLLAEAPLNAVPGMEQKLSAEEKKAGVTSTS